MSDHPKISIISTVYNTGPYLRPAVESILAQTFTDFELLLVDDGSHDGSAEVCDALAGQDARIRVFHQPNGGPAHARNTGLDNACGDYIGIVDSDDLIEPAMFETLYNAVQQPARQCGGLHLLCRAEIQPAAAAGCQLPAGIAQHLQFGVQLQRLRRNRGRQRLGRHNQPQRGQNVCPARRSRRQRCACLPENRHGTPQLSLQILPLVCPAFTPGAVVIAGISKNMQIF